MRRWLVCVGLLLAVTVTWAADAQEGSVVYLKNGSRIRGRVVSVKPQESVAIETADGSLFVWPMADVDRIEADTPPPTASIVDRVVPDTPPTPPIAVDPNVIQASDLDVGGDAILLATLRDELALGYGTLHDGQIASIVGDTTAALGGFLIGVFGSSRHVSEDVGHAGLALVVLGGVSKVIGGIRQAKGMSQIKVARERLDAALDGDTYPPGRRGSSERREE